MKSFIALFCLCLMLGITPAAYGQSPESARDANFNLTVGATGSFFEPSLPSNHMYGIGAYVDTRINRWIQLEGEVRFIRIHSVANQYQDQYLIGPRYTLPRIWKLRPYTKLLLGDTLVDLGSSGFAHRLDLAAGGGVDIKLSRRLYLRAADFEYHYLPITIFNQTVTPWGVSVGVGYRFY